MINLARLTRHQLSSSLPPRDRDLEEIPGRGALNDGILAMTRKADNRGIPTCDLGLTRVLSAASSRRAPTRRDLIPRAWKGSARESREQSAHPRTHFSVHIPADMNVSLIARNEGRGC